MSIKWEEKGCSVCRNLWESGRRPAELAVTYELHARLYKCTTCGTYWEELERYADVISESEAMKLFPDAF